ncbi:MAG: 2,3-bisphosphoglycerate-independent phosphoglycerate mutase [Planctomycetota bacterium]
MHRPLMLLVLDGWGHRDANGSNAIRTHAHYFQELETRFPHTLLSASGNEVGLPLGLMGNSEVGHMNLGAGRVVYQDLTRIDKALEDGSLAENGAIVQLCDAVRQSGKTLHFLGLVSDGGVHAIDRHLRALLVIARERGLRPQQVAVHAILDGRDTPPRSGAGYLAALEADLSAAGVGRIASVVGRYWAMDRDKRWDRVKRAYDLFLEGRGERFDTAAEAIATSYANNVGDEFVEPSVIGDPGRDRFGDGDGLFCFNYRADRMRQIVMALSADAFDEFERARRAKLRIVTMTQYRDDFPFAVAFPPVELRGSFGEVIAKAGLRQERMAETEKYAHVTFFFSGGEERPWPGEMRTLVPSPRVATYDLQPEMSAPELTARILASLARDETDVYVINFANADMVGHTGIVPAVQAAVAVVDECLQKIVPVVLAKGGLVAITADHGNAEMLWDAKHDQPHTAHTTNPVPFVLCANDLAGTPLRPMGTLADVAPTLLELGGIAIPSVMDGRSLLAR